MDMQYTRATGDILGLLSLYCPVNLPKIKPKLKLAV